jgi:thiamine-phosphate pyrophosphorylase
MPQARRPLVCLITDRRRLSTSGTCAAGDLPDLVARAARAGVDLVQIRERDLAGGALHALVLACLEAAAGTGARVLVNDRLDVALAAGAAGVHLRGDGFHAPDVRAIAPAGFLVGRSVHSPEEASAAAARGGLDFLIAGPVCATRSKAPGHPLLGFDGLARVVAAAAGLPVLAVGGMSVATAAPAAVAGAAGLAGIDLFAGSSAGAAPDPEQTVRELRQTFDSVRPL